MIYAPMPKPRSNLNSNYKLANSMPWWRSYPSMHTIKAATKTAWKSYYRHTKKCLYSNAYSDMTASKMSESMMWVCPSFMTASSLATRRPHEHLVISFTRDTHRAAQPFGHCHHHCLRGFGPLFSAFGQCPNRLGQSRCPSSSGRKLGQFNHFFRDRTSVV